MKSILLIGLGRFGGHIAMKLNKQKCEVMAIDKDEKKVNAALPFVTAAQIGDSTEKEFLASLGVENYDVCIVAIGEDFQSSLETTALLKDLGARKVVARAFSDVHEEFLLRNGADEILYPEKQLAAWTAIRYSSDHVFDYVQLDKEHSIFEVAVPQAWAGKTVGQLNVRKMHNVSIMGIRRNGALDVGVTPETYLDRGGTLLVLGTDREIQKCFHL